MSCVRSVEAIGGSFLQAVAHCQKNPFDTSYPTMLDLSGAPDLQRQAFASGYYDHDLPASNAAEAARLQTLQSGLTEAMVVRQKRQAATVKPLSDTECMTYLLGVPHEAFALGPSWDVRGQSPTNPYLTPQENDCLARQREAAAPALSVPAPAHPAGHQQHGPGAITSLDRPAGQRGDECRAQRERGSSGQRPGRGGQQGLDPIKALYYGRDIGRRCHAAGADVKKPLTKLGLRTDAIHKWELREGRIGIELLLSQSRIVLG